MQADYSVELGRDDPALELPWASPDGSARYYDLKRHPELLSSVAEARDCPELAAFLARINADGFPLETAKCDLWESCEIAPEEEIFDADSKFVSYVDLLFTEAARRRLFENHETLVKNVCALLQRAPQISAAVEFVIRRCYTLDGSIDPPDPTGDRGFGVDPGRCGGGPINAALSEGHGSRQGSSSGFCITVYVSGFGNEQQDSRGHWGIALKLVRHAIVQACSRK